MKKLILGAFICPIIFTACQSSSGESSLSATTKTTDTLSVTATPTTDTLKAADAATILARKEVPVLCYHQIREWLPSDGNRAKDDIISPTKFKEHVKMLADSGYQSILPDQLYDYLVYGKALPEKPIMFTFDDTDLDQFTVAYPTLKQYGFKGVYFIMTVSIGRNGKVRYMSKENIKELADKGNTIGSHTYDHQNVKKLVGDDWTKQIDKPTKTLEEITGKKIIDFAYPFGLWNKEAIPELKKRGFRDAYILATARDENDPLYTIRRIIASGFWSAKTLHNSMVNSFGEKKKQ